MEPPHASHLANRKYFCRRTNIFTPGPAPVEAGLDVAGLAEELVAEDDIVHLELDAAHGALETLLVPGQGLTTLGVHLHPSCRCKMETVLQP